MTGRVLRPRPVTASRRHTGQPAPRPRPRPRATRRRRASLEQTLRNYRALHPYGVDLVPPLDIVVVDQQCRPVWPVPAHISRVIDERRRARYSGRPFIPAQRKPDPREVIRRVHR